MYICICRDKYIFGAFKLHMHVDNADISHTSHVTHKHMLHVYVHIRWEVVVLDLFTLKPKPKTFGDLTVQISSLGNKVEKSWKKE